MNPKNYGPGKRGEHITWLGQRLILHGFGKHYRWGPGPSWSEADRLNVRDFQLAQGWTGSDADGYPGRESLRRLSQNPPAPEYPGQVLDLEFWKITLPTGVENKPDEVKQPLLDEYVSEYFRVVVGGSGVSFIAPVDGVTTSNSGYPRSELREMWLDGDYGNSRWSMKSGTHIMRITQAILRWPEGKREVVAGQIHDGVDDICMIRAVAKGSSGDFARLYAEKSNGKGEGSERFLLDDNYVRGTRFTVTIAATKHGVSVFYNDVWKAGWEQQEWSDDKNYFKAGCYTQANESNGSGHGEVVVYSLDVTHTP